MLRTKHSFLFPEIKPIGSLKKAVYSESQKLVSSLCTSCGKLTSETPNGGVDDAAAEACNWCGAVQKVSAEDPPKATQSRKIECFKKLDGYMLDWSSVDKIKKDKFNCWASEYSHKLVFVPTIPLEYKWIEDLKFMIPDTYLSEIRRNAHIASEEWNIRRPFDTMIREACLAPAIEHIFTAFYLLGDCVYNEKSFGYDHDFPYANILAYKFWMYQTGGGLVWDHSHGDRIDWVISQVDKSIWSESCRRWKVAADRHHDEWETYCQPKDLGNQSAKVAGDKNE